MCKKYLLLKIFLGFLLISCFTACIKEELSQCDYNLYLYLKVSEKSTNNDWYNSSASLDNALLYIFDKNGNFLDTHKVEKEVIANALPIILSYPGERELQVYAWGNYHPENETIIAPSKGQSVESAYLSLIRLPQKFLALSSTVYNPIVKSPSDLFHGMKQISLRVVAGKKNEQSIEMTRKIGSAEISVTGLDKFFQEGDSNFSIIMGESSDRLDFSGNTFGSLVNYRPQTFSFLNNQGRKVLKTNIFNALPTGENENLCVYILRGSELIYTIGKDQLGKNIKIKENMLLSIDINLSPMLNVNVSIIPWDEISQRSDI